MANFASLTDKHISMGIDMKTIIQTIIPLERLVEYIDNSQFNSCAPLNLIIKGKPYDITLKIEKHRENPNLERECIHQKDCLKYKERLREICDVLCVDGSEMYDDPNSDAY